MSTSNTLAKNILKNMKRLNIALFCLLLIGILYSCSKATLNYTQNGNWVSRAIFSGVPMGYGTSFVIGNEAYVGTGFNPVTPNPPRLKTMYKYTPGQIPNTATGYDSAYGGWTQVADFGGTGRSNAVGFNIGNFGYIGSGTPDGIQPLADFWKYNPTANNWTRIADLGSDSAHLAPRFDAVAFNFDTCAYVLTGTDNSYYFGDVWRYNPTSNTWTQRVSMPGSQRSQAVAWSYKGRGYLLTGYTPGSQWAAGGNACYDFWRFDPSLPEGQGWTRLRDIYNTQAGTYDDGYTNIVRYHAVGFTISNVNNLDKGYITLGQNGTLYTYTWEYDFASDLWTEKTPYEGAARVGAVGFTVQNRGFVATGVSGNSAYNDVREFFPTQIYNQYD
jgi:N-acetylneuraminic acid mutarotase